MRTAFFLALLALCFVPRIAAEPGSVLHDFVTARGDRLYEGETEFRFVSVNLPDALQIISNDRFDDDQPGSHYRLPDEFEQRDAIESVRQFGGRVVRAFVITCRGGPESAFNVSSTPVVGNEEALRVIDKLLQVCNEKGVRVIIPLVAYKSSVRGDWTKYGQDFWQVGSAGNERFKNMLSQLLTRTNAFTGTRYLDDKAILGWQTGNELVIGDDPERRAWVHDIAAYIKKIDLHHLVIDGRNKPNDVYGKSAEFLGDPNIDAISYHTYVNLPQANTPAGTLKLIRDQFRGKKVLLLTEVAMYTTPKALRELLDEVDADGTSGALWWALRFHNRDGGFYKHSDRNSQFEDLNWPGFATGKIGLPEIAKERELLTILAEYAPRISKLPAPRRAAPEPPHFLPANDAGHLSFQGSTGADRYDIQRAEKRAGPWHSVAVDFTDNLNVYAPLFCDESAEIGRDYFYRAIAKNEVGPSSPSNIIGPIHVNVHWLVDDLFDLGKCAAETINVSIDKSYAHDAYLEDIAVARKEDPARDAQLVYRTSGSIRRAVVEVFGTKEIQPTFFLGTKAGAEREAAARATFFNEGARARYEIENENEETVTLKIVLPSESPASQAVGRVEISSL
ncbi:MAG TPA: hypothetical protein VFT72_02235 [Opitutaceae bacterium]|nr:hypothetical protein [Opitutaceae bacterium]